MTCTNKIHASIYSKLQKCDRYFYLTECTSCCYC